MSSFLVFLFPVFIFYMKTGNIMGDFYIESENKVVGGSYVVQS